MRALPLALALVTGCATVPPGPPPPPPELSFRGVSAVALVHRIARDGHSLDPGAARRRDPLDALAPALASRGLKALVVELPASPAADLAAVDALARQVEAQALAARPEEGGPVAGSVGAGAAAPLAQLGVEALAVYVRAPGWGAPPPYPMFGTPLLAPPSPPASALALVARDGTVLTFAWGGGQAPFGSGPLNAAEAIDAVLAVLVPPPAE